MSVKASKKKIALLALVPAVFIVILVAVLISNGKNQNTMAKYVGETDANRVSFLNSFGWEVEKEPKEVKEVVIPEAFDQVYLNYNEIQKEDGFDLEKYAGCRVKRWTYEITNYPGGEEGIVANVLVYNGKIIGGDICSIALDGFMHSFSQNSPGGVDA